MCQRPDRRLVDPRDEEPAAVGGPPVAAGTVHLLGGDELGQAERDAVLAARPRCPAGREVDDVQRAVVHVGDLGPGRVGPRVKRRASWPGPAAARRRRVAPSGTAYTCPDSAKTASVRGAVGGVGHDPGGGLPHPLAPRPFLRRQVLLVGAERPRVGDKPLRAGGGVGLPQAGHRVVARLGPQEGDPFPVRRYLEGPGHPEREPARPRLLPGKALRHASDHATGPTWTGITIRSWWWNAACCSCTRIRTTSRSAPGRRWPSTPRAGRPGHPGDLHARRARRDHPA